MNLHNCKTQDDVLAAAGDSRELALEHLREYDGAAEHYARRGELPANMGSPGAIDNIQVDPEAFEARVREFQYAIAMGE